MQLCRLLEGHAPESTALVFAQRRWTYAELTAPTDALGARMADLVGERVAFMLPNSPEAVLTSLACFRSGAVAAPLNMRYAAPELERALRRTVPGGWWSTRADWSGSTGSTPPCSTACAS
jgi:long-chain acyl-CoA synthetase